jgi:restriction system protein
MARKKTSTFEDLIGVAAMLPWWLSVIVGAISYLVLHHYATMENVQPADVKDLGGFAGRELYKTLAMFGQYIVPAAFGFGALVSVIGRLRSRRIHGLAASLPKGQKTTQLDWREFEALLAEAFRRRHFRVADTPDGPDGGIDLRLRKDNALYLVQCKHWKRSRVGVNIVRELYGVMAAEGADGGYVVTSGRFTADAKKFAAGKNLSLIDGDELDRMIDDAKMQPLIDTSPPITSKQTLAPDCPVCNSIMVRRTAKKGPQVGKEFWGCSTFPKCRGTRQLD